MVTDSNSTPAWPTWDTGIVVIRDPFEDSAPPMPGDELWPEEDWDLQPGDNLPLTSGMDDCSVERFYWDLHDQWIALAKAAIAGEKIEYSSLLCEFLKEVQSHAKSREHIIFESLKLSFQKPKVPHELIELHPYAVAYDAVGVRCIRYVAKKLASLYLDQLRTRTSGTWREVQHVHKQILASDEDKVLKQHFEWNYERGLAFDLRVASLIQGKIGTTPFLCHQVASQFKTSFLKRAIRELLDFESLSFLPVRHTAYLAVIPWFKECFLEMQNTGSGLEQMRAMFSDPVTRERAHREWENVTGEPAIETPEQCLQVMQKFGPSEFVLTACPDDFPLIEALNKLYISLSTAFCDGQAVVTEADSVGDFNGQLHPIIADENAVPEASSTDPNAARNEFICRDGQQIILGTGGTVARNRWIYERAYAGLSSWDISEELKGIAGWKNISSRTGISGIVRKVAQENELPLPSSYKHSPSTS